MLASRRAGDGPPLLLLNGGMMSMAAWDPVALPLEATHAVIRCDFRGQLLSPGLPPASMRGHAADVASLLDALQLDTVHVAGASFGALAGMALAAAHPTRVRSLSVITATDRVTGEMWRGTETMRCAALAAAGGGNGSQVFDLLAPATFSAGWRSEHADLLAQRRGAIARLPAAWFEGLVGLLDSLRGLDLRPELSRITCPALVVGAELDETFPVEHSRAVAAGIPGARLAIVAGAPHGMVVERPSDIVALIAAFVSDVEAGHRVDHRT